MKTSSDNSLFVTFGDDSIEAQIKSYLTTKHTTEPNFNEFANNTERTIDTETSEKINKAFNKLFKKRKELEPFVSKESFLNYVQTPEQSDEYIKHLMKPLKNLKPKEEKILYSFLKVAVNFLLINFPAAPEEICNLEVISYLTDMMLIEIEGISIFDEFITEKIRNGTDANRSDIKLHYEILCNERNARTPIVILKHLIKIAKNYKPYHQ